MSLKVENLKGRLCPICGEKMRLVHVSVLEGRAARFYECKQRHGRKRTVFMV